ncbi:DgyrCDS3214 [Dimorphilus gyrociliatus]|uniref:DgyrCDS3214 n=1 Tax=Dimorphilus gyrociliatus TaxID=2664684 RepID=A0A7I8VHM1_9ANNE|nr:DgyrCDS3214 [Dimorphilus gyrociliatus]
MVIFTLIVVLAIFQGAEARCFCTVKSNVLAKQTPCGFTITSIPEETCFPSTETKETCKLNENNKEFQSIEYSPGLDLWIDADSLIVAPEYKCQNTKETYEDLAKSCSAIQIVTRSQWQARPPRSRTNLVTPVSMLFVHHTAGATCSSQSTCSARTRAIQNYHMDSNRWNDIGYNFLIGGDGRAYEGRGWSTVGAHTGCHNRRSIAFSAMGNFETSSPPQIILTAIQNLARCAVSRGILSSGYELFGHRDAMSTSCPGRYLYSVIQGWPNFSTRPVRC